MVLGAPVITTATLPSCVIDYAYSETLSAIGITSITWALESGNLPTGLAVFLFVARPPPNNEQKKILKNHTTTRITDKKTIFVN